MNAALHRTLLELVRKYTAHLIALGQREAFTEHLQDTTGDAFPVGSSVVFKTCIEDHTLTLFYDPAQPHVIDLINGHPTTGLAEGARLYVVR